MRGASGQGNDPPGPVLELLLVSWAPPLDQGARLLAGAPALLPQLVPGHPWHQEDAQQSVDGVDHVDFDLHQRRDGLLHQRLDQPTGRVHAFTDYGTGNYPWNIVEINACYSGGFWLYGSNERQNIIKAFDLWGGPDGEEDGGVFIGWDSFYAPMVPWADEAWTELFWAQLGRLLHRMGCRRVTSGRGHGLFGHR